MGEAKLKGCRPSDVVNQDFMNTCADIGMAHYRLENLPKTINALHKRLDELQIELGAAKSQEDAMKAKEAAEAATQEVQS